MQHTYSTLLITILILLAKVGVLHSAAGTLDTTYGSNNTGIEITAIGRQNNLNCVAVLSDDRLVGVGTVTVTTQTSGICCFTSTGTFDASFNSIGYEQLLVGSKTVINAVAMQSDNKAVAGGYTVENNVTKYIVARYDMTGTLDTGFGGVGYVTTDLLTCSSINAIALQPDNKILAGGVAGQGAPKCSLTRYNTDGSLDATFGNGGATFVNPGYVSTIHALALQPDGKILAAGFAWNYSTDVCALIRFNSDGSLDQAFGTNGVVTFQMGQRSQATSIAVQSDGKIIVGGYTTNNSIHYSFMLMRFDTTGTLDPSFNGNGVVITQMNYSSKINALTLQADGKIVAGGFNFGLRNTTFALARYLTDGTLDSSFGTNGITFTTVGSTAQINSLIIQSDGKIVAAGTSDDSAAVVRYFA